MRSNWSGLQIVVLGLGFGLAIWTHEWNILLLWLFLLATMVKES